MAAPEDFLGQEYPLWPGGGARVAHRKHSVRG